MTRSILRKILISGLKFYVLLCALAFISCSNLFREIDKSSITLSLKSKDIQSLLPARSIFSPENESLSDEYYVYSINAYITGDYKTTVSKNIDYDTLLETDEVFITVNSVPSGSNITAELTIEATSKFETGDIPHPEIEKEISSMVLYSASKKLYVSPGKNDIDLSLKNATAPYITDTTKPQFFMADETYNTVLHAIVTVPQAYNTFMSGDSPNFYSVIISKNCTGSEIQNAFEKYISDDPFTTVPEDFEFEQLEYNPDGTGYSYGESDNNNSNIILKKDTDTQYYDSDFYSGWIIEYKDLNLNTKYLYSPLTKLTFKDSNTNFSIESITYSGKTRKDSDGDCYILCSEYDADAFIIKENWGGTIVEGDFYNYSSAGTFTIYNILGNLSVTFDRYAYSKEWKYDFKAILPDISKARLVLKEASLCLTDLNLSNGNSDNWIYYYDGSETTDGNFYSFKTTWYKDSEFIEGFDNIYNCLGVDLTEPGFGSGTYKVLLVLEPAPELDVSIFNYLLKPDGSKATATKDGTGALKIDSYEAEYGPVTLELSSAGINIGFGIPEFLITQKSVKELTAFYTIPELLSFTDSDTLFCANWYSSAEDNGIGEEITSDKYSFAWYLNDTLISENPSFTFNPVTQDLSDFVLNAESSNVLMLILKSKNDSTKMGSTNLTFTFTD